MNVGILGAGQLGRMLALAGYPLGLSFRFFDSVPNAPAGHLAPLTVASFDDHAALDHFARGLDVVTFEFENVPVDAVRHLAGHVKVYPPAEALEAAQDRVAEKTLFRSLGIPTPEFAPVDSSGELATAVQKIGLPAVLKTRRMGYDGKGQAVVRTLPEAEAAMDRLGGRRLILESLVKFDRELSAIAARASDGTIEVYPICENVHEHGILRSTVAPSPGASPGAIDQATRSIRAVLDALRYVGVLAIEFFDVGGQLLANEMAPRVHNTGHWTIEGARTSQFENHLRAITGLPLGDASAVGHCAMVNIIGHAPDPSRILATGAKLHLYGKEPRAGRKLGHATAVKGTSEEARRAAAELGAIVK